MKGYDSMEQTYEIKNLCCANCGAKIERKFNELSEVESAVLNFPMKKFKIKGKISDELLEKLNKIARSVEPDAELVPLTNNHHSKHHDHEHHHHDHDDDCCCGHDHEHEHHEHHHHDHDDDCCCGHDHEHEHHEHHHHDHDEECCCGHDHEHEHHEHHHHDHDDGCCCGHDHEHEHHEHHHDHIKGTEFVIKNLDCAHCGAKIEEAIGKLDGVQAARLNFPLKKLTVSGNVTPELISLMNKTANSIEAGVEIEPLEAVKSHHKPTEEELNIRRELIPIIAGVAVFAAALIVSHATGAAMVGLVLYIIAYLILGKSVLVNTFKNIRAGNFFDENFLMTVATIGAFILGEYSEAVGVVLFFRIGELFEDIAVNRSRKAITDVAELRVDEADVLRDGEFVRIDADEIEVGDILRIKTGERIAADGVVESGESRLDTSAVNGEPVPLTIHPGDAVMSGCINLSDTFTLRATAAADDSMISKIARAVEDASAEKPKIDRFITRFSRVYTPVVITIAALTAVFGSVITGDVSKWVYSALTFLVISCPCALVLSVPLAYFSGIGAASKLGILFKGGSAMEALGKVKAIAFDKTGTLTSGSFTVTSITSAGECKEDELLRICGSCEQTSTHPVAESIVSACRERGLELIQPEKSGEAAGRGVSAVISGKNYLCGSERLMSENGVTIPDMGNVSLGSVVYVAENGKVLGRVVVSDTVKKSSADSIAKLEAMGIKTAMLTGDKKENADAVGKQLGISHVSGGLLPDGKLAELNAIREKYGEVMFVGDGINDAPVLAGADVGGAMQTGADLALEAADAVFMSSEPEAIVRAKRIADKTERISRQNIIFALAIKAAVLVLGLLGHPNMWLAVFADSGVAMLLILNSIRALGTKQYE